MLKPALLACALAAVSLTAAARDDRLKFPISDALANPFGAGKLNDSIKLEFGTGGGMEIGSYTSNKKTNAFNKSDKEACEIAFLSAVIALQERAAKEGGSRVVKIHSIYKQAAFNSTTEYECGAGKLMAGVALRGTVVK